MASIQVVCPYLKYPWCLEDMIESFGESDIPVLIVDNSPNSDMKTMKLPENVEVEYFPTNAGVSGSWNRGLIKGADQTIIISQWVRFAPAEHPRRFPGLWGLNYIAGIVSGMANEYGMTFGDQGFHLISIGRKTVDTIGYFDENYYPTHGEDDDYRHRMDLAGNMMMAGFPNWESAPIFSTAFGVHRRMGDVNFTEHMLDYYSHKWSGKPYDYPGHYPTPFNNPDNSLKYWPEVRNGSGVNWND